MPIVYTPYDRAARESIKMIIRSTPDFADPNTKAALAKYIGTEFPFQFPPKVSSDSKGANWTEADKITYDPLAYWSGATPHKISLVSTYIVTGEKEWNGAEIAKLAHAAKAYFYRSIKAVFSKNNADGTEQGENKTSGPVVEISALYGAVQAKSTWRMTNVAVEYGDTIISDGDGKSYWHLLTKITFDLASYTQLQDASGKSVQNVPSLSPRPTAEWY